MFKVWRSNKKKIKVVFKLQFQATQVPKLKKPALIISLLPEDVGKPTFKLQKTEVKEGICSWENPVYVTVKLNKEIKTGKLHEKIYHFIVSSGSSKSGYLGEASIDFADFAEEIEPMTVDLPLKFANSGAILHITIERVLGDSEQRYTNDDGDQTLSRDESLSKQLSMGDSDGNDKALAQDLNNDEEYGHLSLSARQEDSILQRGTVNGVRSDRSLHRRTSTDWSMGSVSDGSLIGSTNSPDDNLPRECKDTSDETIEKLKAEVSYLTRQSEMSELELQSIRKQIAKENRRSQDLLIQVSDLKEERDAFRIECEQIKFSQKGVDKGTMNQMRAECDDLRLQLEEIKRELSHEKDVNVDLQMQLKKTQDSNSELIVAVRDLDQLLDQKTVEISDLSSQLEVSTDNFKELGSLKHRNADLLEEVGMYKKDRTKVENYIEQLTQDYEDLKLENSDLSCDLEQSQLRELQARNELSESLTKIKDLESQMQRLEETLKKQTQEYSESLLSVNELQSRIKELDKEIEKQAELFEDDLKAMTQAKTEQEQRAIRAEEALRNTRWKNAATAERLQEEFKKLSVEMAGKLDENEKLMKEATSEANELHKQKDLLEQDLRKAKEELALSREQSRVKLEELSGKVHQKTALEEQRSVELDEKSQQLIQTQKHAEEKQEAFLAEIGALKAKVEMLTKEKNDAPRDKKDKVRKEDNKKIKSSSEGAKTVTQRWNKERDELERKLANAKREAEKAQLEVLKLKSMKGEKEKTINNLLSEVESLEARQSVTDKLHAQMEELNEKNKSMEDELKDMQERYSDLSLKFAMVEGERQQLVMAVRNLKNGKKN